MRKINELRSKLVESSAHEKTSQDVSVVGTKPKKKADVSQSTQQKSSGDVSKSDTTRKYTNQSTQDVAVARSRPKKKSEVEAPNKPARSYGSDNDKERKSTKKGFVRGAWDATKKVGKSVFKKKKSKQADSSPEGGSGGSEDTKKEGSGVVSKGANAVATVAKGVAKGAKYTKDKLSRSKTKDVAQKSGNEVANAVDGVVSRLNKPDHIK